MNTCTDHNIIPLRDFVSSEILSPEDFSKKMTRLFDDDLLVKRSNIMCVDIAKYNARFASLLQRYKTRAETSSINNHIYDYLFLANDLLDEMLSFLSDLSLPVVTLNTDLERNINKARYKDAKKACLDYFHHLMAAHEMALKILDKSVDSEEASLEADEEAG